MAAKVKKTLVVVESPPKAKTIEKYLGKNYKVLASYGHVMDLLPKSGSVEPDKDFLMHYVPLEKSEKHIKAIATALKKCNELLLATDPDREGEAIAFHLRELMEDEGLLEKREVKRVVFHEITKRAVTEAIEQARDIDKDLVYAQKARRALDYLVGFNLSPLLWKKIKPSLSAGRVQSPALRLIAERDAEIAKFVSREYWSIEADLSSKRKKFAAKLIEYKGDKLKQFSIEKEESAKEIEAQIVKIADGKLLVSKIDKKSRKRNPAAPFTTSTLQQEASRKLGFGVSKTMRIAQQLYEGIESGEDAKGLISYMRTDSVNLSLEALDEIRDVISSTYGKDSLPKEIKKYKTKSKNVQEAHEAIRPTSASLSPEQAKTFLSGDQYKLYNLIWKRTIACQMIHATLNTVSIDLKCGDIAIFRATGSTIAVPGFMQVYLESTDDEKTSDKDEKILPDIKEGDEVKLEKVKPEQHFTEPPPRFSEASLIKDLEEKGIGRPSTFVPIIQTLQQRGYISLESKRFHITDIGEIVSKFLTKYFNKYVDYDFTAKLEDQLDEVSRGEKELVPLLREFWDPFIKLVDEIQENVSKKEVTQEDIEEKCPECSKNLSIRLGRNGKFIGCTGYPECNYTRNIDGSKDEKETAVVEGRTCPKCESELHIKVGRYGKFIGCSAYPKCKHMEPLEKPEDSGVKCPECEKDNLLKKKSRYGKYFYSCGSYPKCKYAVWNPPVKQSCPECNWPVLTIKTTKRKGEELVCPQKECGFIEPYTGS